MLAPGKFISKKPREYKIIIKVTVEKDENPYLAYGKYYMGSADEDWEIAPQVTRFEVIMKIDRLIGILCILLQKEKVTAAELAEKFEVSRRTIVRDIEDINKAGIPIVTGQGRGGGISVMDSYKLNRTLLSSDDLQTILAGLQGFDRISASNRYQRIMDKLSVQHQALLNSDGQIVIDLSAWNKSKVSEKIELIRSTIENDECLSFVYVSRKGESKRQIEPYRLIFQWGEWYVWGYCDSRKDYRLFKLTRIYDLKCTKEKRAKREIPPYTCNKHFQDRQKIQAVVRFDPSVKWRIVDEFGIELPKFQENGSILVDITWHNAESFFQYLLSYGNKAEIVSPEKYRLEFAAYLKKIWNLYKM